ncbi:MAG: sodium-dependent transporter [Thermoanaerobaculia bacterium]
MRATTESSPERRGTWSRMGFILAASGSAIGLGNIVFFPANAYRFGGGAFYLPYFVALLAVGLPLMTLELGLGHQTRLAFPQALATAGGRRGELIGWWALLNTGCITLYYVTMLGWVIGMLGGALGELWRDSLPVTGFAAAELPNPYGYFYAMLSSWRPLVFVASVWALNGLLVRRGTASIERAVKLFVPLMWLLMLVLVARGLTLPGGPQGVWYLFTPKLEAMLDPGVWQGALGQIFFTLSIGFGVMTTYASYLPRESDQTNNALVVSFLNCGFEYIAGVAVFAILFSFAAVPQASTLSMMFFIVPQGIAQLPGGQLVVVGFGSLFFLLLLLAGLSSSISMVESLVCALIDKLGWRRGPLVVVICLAGATGSCLFTLPWVVDPGLAADGTLGLTLLDLVDHWAFTYGLLAVGFSECLLLGWGYGVDRIRSEINRSSRWRLGSWFDRLVRWVLPAAILLVLGGALWQEIEGGLYGVSYGQHYPDAWRWLAAGPWLVPVLWLSLPGFAALGLSRLRRRRRPAVAPGEVVR